MVEPVYGWQVIIARLAGGYKAHLCEASIIRVMPENEIPPAIEQVRLKRTIDKSPLDVVELRYHIKGVIVCRDNIQI